MDYSSFLILIALLAPNLHPLKFLVSSGHSEVPLVQLNPAAYPYL